MIKTIAKWLLRKELSNLHSTIIQQEKEIEVLRLGNSIAAQPKPEVRLTTRLAYSEFQRFKASLPAALVTNATTDLQAASLVGQQMVLDKLERDLVSG